MSDAEIKEYYDFILPKVLDAGRILREAKDVQGEEKNGVEWDMVTVYDRKIESILNEQIKIKYPEHKFIGEESSETTIDQLTNDPTWIIDPIDGTENFVKHLGLYCISVALTVDKQQTIGIVYNPHLDELFTAIKGAGAYLNGTRIQTTGQTDLRKSFFNYELGVARMSDRFFDLYMFRLKYLLKEVLSFRTLGCAALGLCYVACGRTDAYQCDGLHVWDAAAGTLIVTEAGGHVIDSSGKEFDLLRPNFLATASETLAQQYLVLERRADEERDQKLEFAL